MTRIILVTTVDSNMALLKRIYWKILVIAILSVSVKCGATENHINFSLSLSNSTETERINDRLNAVEGKFGAFEATVASNVSKYAENVSVQMDKFQQAVDTKLITIQDKFDAFEATAASNLSKYAENVSVQMDKFQQAVDTKPITIETECNELAPSVSNLVDKFNALEGKVNALENTVSNFVGHIKDTLLKPSTNCTNIFANPILNLGSGIYNIQLNGDSSPFAVYCLADPKGGLPWTVVQRRVDASVSFYRTWADYKAGFGDLNHNFFIGLDHLYSLTNTAGPQELWVKLTDPDGITAHAYYDLFAIGNEAEQYALKALGKFSGDAGDSFSSHKGCKFSTFDRDNDRQEDNCAQTTKGAWWYRGIACQRCNLNGLYGSKVYDQGVTWDYYRGSEVSMRYAHMAIRPIRK